MASRKKAPEPGTVDPALASEPVPSSPVKTDSPEPALAGSGRKPKPKPKPSRKPKPSTKPEPADHPEPDDKPMTKSEIRSLLDGIAGLGRLFVGEEWDIEPAKLQKAADVLYPIAQKHEWKSGTELMYVEAGAVLVQVFAMPVRATIDKIRHRGRPAPGVAVAPDPGTPTPVREPKRAPAPKPSTVRTHAPEPSAGAGGADPFRHKEGFPTPPRPAGAK